MWSTTACVFPSVEYFYSMSCSCLLPRNVGHVMSWPLGPIVYPTVVTRSVYGVSACGVPGGCIPVLFVVVLGCFVCRLVDPRVLGL